VPKGKKINGQVQAIPVIVHSGSSTYIGLAKLTPGGIVGQVKTGLVDLYQVAEIHKLPLLTEREASPLAMPGGGGAGRPDMQIMSSVGRVDFSPGVVPVMHLRVDGYYLADELQPPVAAVYLSLYQQVIEGTKVQVGKMEEAMRKSQEGGVVSGGPVPVN